MALVQLKPKATMNIGSIAHNRTPRIINPSSRRMKRSLNVTQDVLSVSISWCSQDHSSHWFHRDEGRPPCQVCLLRPLPRMEGVYQSRCHNSTPRLVSHLSDSCMGDASPNFSTDMATNPKKNPILFKYKSVAYYWLCLATSEWLHDKDCAGYHHLF